MYLFLLKILLSCLSSERILAQPSYYPRNADNKLALPLPKTEFLMVSLGYIGVRVWNSSLNEIRNCEAELCLGLI